MTKDEAIEILEKEKAYMLGHGGDRQVVALDMAIKALEKESTTKNNLGVDCIDRKKLIDWINIWDITPIIKNPLIRHIQGMPPITPQNPIEKCTWIKYDYRTMRPKDHDVNNSYWRIPENRMDTLKYCPYCGKEIEVEL